MTEIIGQNSLLTAIDPNSLKEGTETNKVKSQIRHNDGLKKFTHIAYVRSFTSIEKDERTLLHWRDLLIGLSISLCMRSVLSHDQSLSKMTNQALYLYKNYDVTSFYKSTNQDFKGLFSTISYLFEGNSFEYPISTIQDLLRNFWDYISWDHKQDDYFNPHEAFLSRLLDINVSQVGKVFNDISSIEGELDRINSSDQLSSDDKNIKGLIRRNLLNPSDWQFLPLRLILSEYDEEILSILNKFKVSHQPSDWATKLHQRAIGNYAPYGTVGVYIALIAQSYINTARFITDLDERYRNIPINEVMDNKELRRKQLQGIPERLLTALDAASYLYRFGTIREAGGILKDTSKTIADYLEQEIKFSNYQLRRSFKQ